MKNIEDVCVLISARLNSHRIPKKMIAPFAGTTLLDVSLETLLSSNVIPRENIVLAVYEEELASIGQKYDINIYRRNKDSSQSEGKDLAVLYDWHDKLDFKYVVMINPCLPFLTINTIDRFFLEYLKSDFDGMFGVIDKKNYFWNSDGDLITKWTDGLACMNTKFVDSTYEAANCLYASKLSLIKEGSWMGQAPYTKNNPVIYPISEKECFDIDYPWQFERAEILYRELS